MYKTDHGCLHGCGSLTVRYYSNGSVESARKTFQPDGGIQYYDITIFFNEDGTFNREEDNSWDPFQDPKIIPIENPNPPRKDIKSEPKVVDSLVLICMNTNPFKVELLVGQKGSVKKVIKIKKHQDFILGKYLPINGKEDALLIFEIDIIPSKKSKRIILLSETLFKSGPNRYLNTVLAPNP